MAPTMDEAAPRRAVRGARGRPVTFVPTSNSHGEAREHGVRAIPPQGEEGHCRDQRRHHEIGVRRRCLQGDDGKRREDERAEGGPTAVESDAGRGSVDRHHCEEQRGELHQPDPADGSRKQHRRCLEDLRVGGKSLIRESVTPGIGDDRVLLDPQDRPGQVVREDVVLVRRCEARRARGGIRPRR